MTETKDRKDYSEIDLPYNLGKLVISGGTGYMGFRLVNDAKPENNQYGYDLTFSTNGDSKPKSVSGSFDISNKFTFFGAVPLDGYYPSRIAHFVLDFPQKQKPVLNIKGVDTKFRDVVDGFRSLSGVLDTLSDYFKKSKDTDFEDVRMNRVLVENLSTVSTALDVYRSLNSNI